MSSKTEHLAAFFKMEFFCLGKSPIFALLKDIFTSTIGLSFAELQRLKRSSHKILFYSTRRCLISVYYVRLSNRCWLLFFVGDIKKGSLQPFVVEAKRYI